MELRSNTFAAQLRYNNSRCLQSINSPILNPATSQLIVNKPKTQHEEESHFTSRRPTMTRTEYRMTSAAAEIETHHARSNIRATTMPPLRLLLLFVLLLLLPNQSASLENETPNPSVDYYTLLNLTLSHLDLPLTSLTKYHYNINSHGLTPFTESSAKKSYRKLARKYHPDKNRKSTTKTTKVRTSRGSRNVSSFRLLLHH